MNNLCLLERNLNTFNINENINTNNPIQAIKIITTQNQVIQIFDNVYNLLFKNSNIFNYDINKLKLLINVKQKNSNKLGECIFKKCICRYKQSIFDCNGPDAINIYLDNKSSGIRVAMTIAHEIMHIYFHQLKHYNKNITNINGEEGLCELVAFYVGLFIKTNLEFPYYSLLNLKWWLSI